MSLTDHIGHKVVRYEKLMAECPGWVEEEDGDVKLFLASEKETYGVYDESGGPTYICETCDEELEISDGDICD